jgi:hypothetical protein
VVVKNNVAYVAGGGNLRAWDLSVSPATLSAPGQDCGDSYSVAVDGTYAYLGGTCGSGGYLTIYDVTNPKAPVYLRGQSTLSAGSSLVYTQLIPYGNYLIGIGPNSVSNTGHDVVVLDKLDVNNLSKVSDIDIPGIGAFRGALLGSMLYVVNGGKLGVVDLSNVAAPTYTVVSTMGTAPGGVAVAGNVVAVGDGGAGVTFFDVTTPTAPRLIGTQNVGGTSWDVRFAGGKLYVADEQGIAVINGVSAPPVVDASRVTITRSGTATATITGNAGAIASAASPLTVDVNDTTSSAAVSGVTVGADGSFNTTLSANAGDVVTITARDASGGNSRVISIGSVPFAATRLVATGPLTSDSNFRTRRIATEGTTLAAVTYPYVFDTNKLEIFSIASGTPVWSQTINNSANTRDVVVKNNVAYVAGGGNLRAWDLSVTPATVTAPGQDCGDASSVAVDGTHAYVGGNCGSGGYITIFDVTNPKAPVYLRGQSTLSGGSGLVYSQLIPYGTNQLVGISPAVANSRGHDVVIIDHTNFNSLTTVADIDIPGVDLFRARIVGHMLYGASLGGVAILDLSNPTAPAVIVHTPGMPRGLEVDPATLRVYVTESCAGVTVIDASVPASAHVIGTQTMGGDSWEAVFSGQQLFVASEEMINVLDFTATGGSSVGPVTQAAQAPAPLPDEPVADALHIDRSRITVVPRDGRFAVHGSPGAVTGSRPVTVEIRNQTLGTSNPVIAVAGDGSFEAVIDAARGDRLLLRATTGTGESGDADLGDIPLN